MQNFIAYVAKSLVNYPEHIRVVEIDNQNELQIELYVSSAEVGKIIGKNGIMADSFRTLINFYSTKVLKKPISFRIIESNQIH